MEYVLILTSAGNNEEAVLIANTIVSRNLAACVNIIPNVNSVYKWKGEMCSGKEFILFIKTMKMNEHTIFKLIQELHSYELPEIITLPIENGSKDYLNWINTTISS